MKGYSKLYIYTDSTFQFSDAKVKMFRSNNCIAPGVRHEPVVRMLLLDVEIDNCPFFLSVGKYPYSSSVFKLSRIGNV